ncbi:MAG: hypothetical protein NZ608_05550 [candidate division WOR-3 bacterium]|nr:hypothetical protein [candidate division WOR-3 bacterium]
MVNKIRKLRNYSFAFGWELFKGNNPDITIKKAYKLLRKMRVLGFENLIKKKEVLGKLYIF